MKLPMKKLLSLLLLLLMLCGCAAAEQETETLPTMELHQVMLGCADGYLIRFGDCVIFIDGGEALENKPENLFQNYLEAAGVTHVDVYFITHWHTDHCVNLNKLLARWGDENTVVYGPLEKENSKYSPLANGATYRQLRDGDELTIGGLLQLTCVGPEKVVANGTINADSLNFVVTYGNKRILFTGDYAASGNINRKYQDLVRYIDVLKFPHHGIRDTSTHNYEMTVPLAKTLTPRYVLIPGTTSVWEMWNFLAAYALDSRLTRNHLYDDRYGNVVMLTDGERIAFCTDANPADYNPYQPDRTVVETE